MYPDVGGWNIKRHAEAGGDKGAVGFIGRVASDDVDCCTTQPAFIAEQIVNGCDRLDAANGFAEMAGPGGVLIVAQLDGQQGSDCLKVVADAMMHLLQECRRYFKRAPRVLIKGRVFYCDSRCIREGLQ